MSRKKYVQAEVVYDNGAVFTFGASGNSETAAASKAHGRATEIPLGVRSLVIRRLYSRHHPRAAD